MHMGGIARSLRRSSSNTPLAEGEPLYFDGQNDQARAAYGDALLSARERSIPTSSDGLKPGQYMCLTVTDSGEGMDKVTLERATEPFSRRKDWAKAQVSAFRWSTDLPSNRGASSF
jgi:hypothetical protein